MRKLLVVLLALTGCKSQKVIAVETEISAARARLATLEKKRQDLNAESRKLQIERKTFSQQADEAALARERLVAAGLVLNGQPIPDGIQLDEALRAKSPTLGALAATIVQRQLPCADPDAPEETDGYQGDCSPPPLEDACDGVAERNTQSLQWSCEVVDGPIKAAVCTAAAELDANAFSINAPTTHVNTDVVRLAYEKNGRLVVADWPPPDRELYEPTNWMEKATCEAENGHNECIRTCDERHGRLNSNCEDWEGAPDGYEGDDDENPEPSELRAAREAAARAEQEAEEARNELSYQECLAGCESGEEAEPEPIARVSLDFKRSPAPGLFQFDVALEQDDGGVPPHAVLLSFPALHEQLDGTAAFEKDADDTVLGLETALDVMKVYEGPVKNGERVLAGLTLSGFPTGVRVAMDGKHAPVALGLDEVCEFGAKVEPAPWAQECLAAKVAEEKAKAAAAAKAARDAGVDAGVDAGPGTSPLPDPLLPGGEGDAGRASAPLSKDAGVTP